ncbi:MAG: hypothetical protein CM15mV79_480 [uncultured marine virus]|nr:MAG: hypothetical protein CM15mV79_480 [uncultured marine virus]
MKPSEYLTDTYVGMVGQLFDDVYKDCAPCAMELMMSHGHLMSDYQRKALSAFIAFWDALEDLERESEARE